MSKTVWTAQEVRENYEEYKLSQKLKALKTVIQLVEFHNIEPSEIYNVKSVNEANKD